MELKSLATSLHQSPTTKDIPRFIARENMMQHPSKLIAIIATERTGTNYFCDLVGKGLQLKQMWEIFHPSVPFGLTPEDIASGCNIPIERVQKMSDIDRASLVRKNCRGIVTYLSGHEETSLFKIFPNHLNAKQVRRQILKNQKVQKVIIDRNVIDVYVSELKAVHIQKWGHVDTSEIRVMIDFGRFKKWLQERRRWYSHALEILQSSGQDYIYYPYSKISSLSPEDLVHDFHSSLSSMGIEVESREGELENLLQKQDRSKSYSEKVKNWDEFQRQADRIQFDLKGSFLNQ
ncbi:hypothetical protein A3709_02750 [Halioglobus sp. HI00S01]|uniref:hypothetical protein n=1 Tax=Halioglobus sp. HI00S01 TaxID=1822214 RepID=UPI0007C37FE2|nr:hypothetical protein [Halioglobus sp. HI00S01]KZX58398.1 hypothetical protein A3709_02750 [Halioglobus sp. HI00S01]